MRVPLIPRPQFYAPPVLLVSKAQLYAPLVLLVSKAQLYAPLVPKLQLGNQQAIKSHGSTSRDHRVGFPKGSREGWRGLQRIGAILIAAPMVP